MKLEQNFSVAFHYEIHFTQDVFHPDNDVLGDILLGQRPRVMVFVDSGLQQARPSIQEEISAWFKAHAEQFEACGPLIVAGGEACKNDPQHYLGAVKALAAHGFDRHSYVIIVGGGAVLDTVGFAASIAHRGIRHVRVPTTVLAQCDSGIGVKNGINFAGMKNFLGTFAPPWAVVNDFHFLRTLALRDWIAGVAEAFKVAIIKDEQFLSFLTTSAAALRQRDEDAMCHLIQQCARLHADHIRESCDPFEAHSARPLDFGHWSAHHLEMLSNHELRHGEAVAIGIALDLTIARNRRLISTRELETVVHALRRTGLPLWHRALQRRDESGTLVINRGLEEFRQHLGGELTLAMPQGLGHSCQVTDLSYDEIERALAELTSLQETLDHETHKRQPSHVLP
jgi:3-dehydroquinate synthase